MAKLNMLDFIIIIEMYCILVCLTVLLANVSAQLTSGEENDDGFGQNQPKTASESRTNPSNMDVQRRDPQVLWFNRDTEEQSSSESQVQLKQEIKKRIKTMMDIENSESTRDHPKQKMTETLEQHGNQGVPVVQSGKQARRRLRLKDRRENQRVKQILKQKQSIQIRKQSWRLRMEYKRLKRKGKVSQKKLQNSDEQYTVGAATTFRPNTMTRFQEERQRMIQIQMDNQKAQIQEKRMPNLEINLIVEAKILRQALNLQGYLEARFKVAKEQGETANIFIQGQEVQQFIAESSNKLQQFSSKMIRMGLKQRITQLIQDDDILSIVNCHKTSITLQQIQPKLVKSSSQSQRVEKVFQPSKVNNQRENNRQQGISPKKGDSDSVSTSNSQFAHQGSQSIELKSNDREIESSNEQQQKEQQVQQQLVSQTEQSYRESRRRARIAALQGIRPVPLQRSARTGRISMSSLPYSSARNHYIVSQILQRQETRHVRQRQQLQYRHQTERLNIVNPVLQQSMQLRQRLQRLSLRNSHQAQSSINRRRLQSPENRIQISSPSLLNQQSAHTSPSSTTQRLSREDLNLHPTAPPIHRFNHFRP